MKRVLRMHIKLLNGTKLTYSSKYDTLRFVDFDTEKMTLYFFDREPKTLFYDGVTDFKITLRLDNADRPSGKRICTKD